MEPFGKSLLVLGGARSGKSRLAQAAAEERAGRLIFVATAESRDAEMQVRIERHQSERGERWTSVEEPIDLARVVADHGDRDAVLLIDCLTLWASNLMLADDDVDARIDALIAAMARSPAAMIFVANEVGLGIVPDNALARRFRDVAGALNQRVAAVVESVEFVAAGLGLRLKTSSGHRLS